MTTYAVTLTLGSPTRRAVIRLAIHMAGVFDEVRGSARLLNRLTTEEMKQADTITLCEREINALLNGLGKIDSSGTVPSHWNDEAVSIKDDINNNLAQMSGNNFCGGNSGKGGKDSASSACG